MSWLLLSIASAFLLGLYDYFKKTALQGNAVMPVLYGAVAAGALAWLPFVVWSATSPETLPSEFLHVTGLPWRAHLLLLSKAALVGLSWLCGYYGLEALPLSIASPIRATSPLWTILMAVLVMGESPSLRQWIGVVVILLSFFAFTVVGRREGFRLEANKSLWLILLATLLGAASAVYDKHLLQNEKLAPGVVQAWFSIYTLLIMSPPMWLWMAKGDRSRFIWRWSIPVIGVTLLMADILYFIAVSQPDALISIISPVRRTSVVVSFLLGVWLLRETRVLAKALCLAGILAGVLLLA